MTWRDKSCEHCVFRVDSECRRFPPSDMGYARTSLQISLHSYDFRPACAEYSEMIDKPLEAITEEV